MEPPSSAVPLVSSNWGQLLTDFLFHNLLLCFCHSDLISFSPFSFPSFLFLSFVLFISRSYLSFFFFFFCACMRFHKIGAKSLIQWHWQITKSFILTSIRSTKRLQTAGEMSCPLSCICLLKMQTQLRYFVVISGRSKSITTIKTFVLNVMM